MVNNELKIKIEAKRIDHYFSAKTFFVLRNI